MVLIVRRGQVTISPEDDLEDNVPLDKWFAVQTRPGKKRDKVSGELHLILHYASREVRP